MEFRDVGPGTAVLIFEEVGPELICPDLENPAFDEEPFPDHLQLAAAVGMLIASPDPRFVELRGRLEIVFNELCNESEDAPAS